MQRNLIDLFDGGIFARRLELGNIQMPALFFGDSKYDYAASRRYEGLDIVFLSGWTEVSDSKTWIESDSIEYCERLSDFV